MMRNVMILIGMGCVLPAWAWGDEPKHEAPAVVASKPGALIR